MPEWLCAATLDDLWQNEVLGVRVGATDVVLCNVDGHVTAFEDRCPHLGGAPSDGVLDAHVLTCVSHEWAFDVRTGCGTNPSTACLRRFPVRMEGDRILVELEGATG
jgi:nitrite reductase/ring-hydroxylating ferredoxin subunit